MRTETVLVIGRGGREHALAWKLAQSPRVQRVWVAPGNGGTALAGGKVANADVQETNFPGLIDFARQNGVTLDRRRPGGAAGRGHRRRVPGGWAALLRSQPRRGADRGLQGLRQGLHGPPRHPHGAAMPPSTDFAAALAHLRQVDYPVVLKASGLAAGKGVILPASPGQGRGCAAPDHGCARVRRGRRRSGDRGAAGGVGGVGAGVERWPHGGAHAGRAGPQAGLRRRPGPQHRRHGRLRAGAADDTRAAKRGEAHRFAAGHRRPGGRGHALRWRAVRRGDAHCRWPQDAGVQLSLGRPGNPGHPAAAG